jgi:hypothetical protein
MPSPSRRTANDVGTLWTLRSVEGRARCALLSWPRDWELRVVINGDTCLTRRCSNAQEAFALAERWKRKLIAQGWRQVIPRAVGAGAEHRDS